MKITTDKVIYWTPRILSIIFILFLALFSLDVFEPGLSMGQIMLGLFMHNIPSLVLLAVLLIAWRYEIVGGIAYILAGILYIIFAFGRNGFQLYLLVWSAQIAGPAFLIGALFLIGWFRKKHK